jgi:hypothetical protein
VTYRPVARQRLGEHIPAEANESNNTTSITKQQISKQTLSTIERLRFLLGPCRGVIKQQRKSFELLVVRCRESSAEEEFIYVSCCRELGRVLGKAVEGD